MRRIVAGLFVSLDGVVDMQDRSIAPYFSDELIAHIQADQEKADTRNAHRGKRDLRACPNSR